MTAHSHIRMIKRPLIVKKQLFDEKEARKMFGPYSDEAGQYLAATYKTSLLTVPVLFWGLFGGGPYLL